MPELQASIAFPGIPPESIISASFALNHGTKPSICTIRVIPHQNIKAETGTLEIKFGKVHLKFADCKLDDARSDISDRGTVLTLRILDRRWKWQYGSVSGRYNFRGRDGKIDTKRPTRTIPELARVLLKDLGEESVDLSALPTDLRPEISWYDTPPAAELSRLVESVGCRVVLGSDDQVSIRKLGEGKKLPTDAAMNASIGLESAVLPDSLQFIAGPNVYQSRLLLEPVGEETDGSLLPIDELSYKPEGGWEGKSPGDVIDTIYKRDGIERTTRELALATVRRWYKITGQADGKLSLPGESVKVKSIEQFLLLDHQAEETTDGEGFKQYKPPEVLGTYWDNTDRAYCNTAPGTPYKKGFRIDRERKLVIFTQEVFQGIAPDGAPGAPSLFLQIAYNFRARDEYNLTRFRRTRKLATTKRGAGPLVILRRETSRVKIVEYEGEKTVKRITTNDAEL